MALTAHDDVYCPGCGSHSVGRIGTRQYFCWDCCVEFLANRDGTIEVFNVQLDGTLELVGTKEEVQSE